MLYKKSFWLTIFVLGLIIQITTSCNNTKNNTITQIDTVFVIDTVYLEKEHYPYFDISARKLHVFYIGVDNPIDILSCNTEGEITVEISNGEITPSAHNSYKVYVNKVGNTTIKASIDGELIGKKTFTCLNLPDPVASVGGKRGGSIKKSTIIKQRYITTELQILKFYFRTHVVNFTVSTSKYGSQGVESNSNEITKEQQNLISELESGDKVYFENIKAQAPDGSIRDLGSIIFTIEKP